MLPGIHLQLDRLVTVLCVARKVATRLASLRAVALVSLLVLQ